jgi:MFS family permease
MIAGWLAWLPVPLIFSVAGNWIQMLPGMVLWGVWLGGPTGTAYMVTSADKSRLTLTFAAISSSWSLGYIFSPAIGGYLSAAGGMRIVFYSAFIFYAMASLTLVFISSQRGQGFTQKTSEKQHSFFKLLKTGKLLRLSIFFASIMFFLMMFRPFIPKFLADIHHYGDLEIGVLGSISFFSSAVLGILLGRLGDRWKKTYALSISMALCSLSLVLLLFSGDFRILTITFFLIGGSYITWSLMGAIIGPLAPESIRARWISIPQAIAMFSSFVAPYAGGILYDLSAYYPFVIAIIITLVLALLAISELFAEQSTER